MGIASISRRNLIKGVALGAGAAATASLAQGALAAEAAPSGIVAVSATAPGFGGDVVVTLSVDTATGAVVDAAVEGAGETPDRGGRAIANLQAAMLETGTIDVESVAGATVTSDAVVDAAVEGAGETPDRGGRAIANLQAAMLETGTIDVESVAGATVTSDAVVDAATSAYNEAMGITSSTVVKMKPGTYTAGAKGYWQIWELPVSVTVNESSILKIETPEDRFAHGESEVILQSVKDLMFPRIIESQSIAVDAITGATASSNAVKLAMKKALQQALTEGGSDPSAVSAFMVPPAKPEPGEPETIDVDVLVVGMGTGGIIAMKSAVEEIQKRNGYQLVSVLGIDRAGKYGGKSALTHEGCAINPPRYQELFNNGEPFDDAEAFKRDWKTYCTTDGQMMAKEDIIDLYFEESGNTIDWLFFEQGWKFGSMGDYNEITSQGWKFGSMGDYNEITSGLTSFNMVLTSNKDTGSYEDRRKGVEAYYKAMLSAVKAQGGDYMLETEAYDLLMDGDRVTGVLARNLVTGQEYVINAKAVIMNTGGFGSNPEMIDELLDPRWRGERRGIGTGQDTGLMVKAALEHGAGTWNIEMSPNVMHVTLDHWMNRYPINFYDDKLDGRTGRYKTWTLNNIPMACGISANTVAVTRDGARFMNEARYESFSPDIDHESWPCYQAGSYYYTICGISANTVAVTRDGARFMNEARYESFSPDIDHESWPCYQAGSYYYTILSDDVLAEIAAEGFNKIPKFEGYCSQGDIPAGMPVPEVYEGLDFAVEEGMAFRGETLAELASAIGVDPTTLEGTVAEYNAVCEAGEDAVFEKKPEFLTKLENGPWYAIKVYPAHFSTAGGLDVDRQIRVLKDDHVTPIEGLYAIGVDSMGVLLNPNRNYAGYGGPAQGWLWTSGRLAGIDAARYIDECCGGFTYVSPALVDVQSVSTAK